MWPGTEDGMFFFGIQMMMFMNMGMIHVIYWEYFKGNLIWEGTLIFSGSGKFWKSCFVLKPTKD